MHENQFFDPLIFDAPWMIERSAMEAIVARLRHLGMQADLRIPFKDASGNAQDNPPYELRGNIAVIRINGPLTKEASLFSRLFAGAGVRSYSDIIAAVTAADKDPAVSGKVLVFNTPGGIVPGAFETAHFLAASGNKKPLYAYVDGQMTSAGQLLGSAARRIAAPKTAQVGSIGVLWMHINEQKLNEKIGIEVSYLTAGKYKAYGNPDEPLSKEARDYLQDRIDRTYSFFIDDVARYRNMEVEDVLSAAEGQVFLAEQGKEAGLVDEIVTDFEAFLKTLTTEASNMDVNELKTKHPDLYAQVLDQGKQEGMAAAKKDQPDPKAAAAQETERVMSIVKVVAGDQMADQVKKISDSGMTADQLEAVKGIFAVHAPAAGNGEESSGGSDAAAAPSRKEILEALQQTGNQPVNAGGQAAAAGGQPVDFLAEVEVFKAAHPDTTHFAAIQAVRKTHPQAYKKWMEAENRR